MANTSVTSVSPPEPKKLKRSYSTAVLELDDEAIKSKRVKCSSESDNGQFERKPPSPVKKFVSDTTIESSPLTDSGYDGNTPGSCKPWKFVQPGSSGYISDSDCGTPANGQRTPGPFSPDFVPRGKFQRTIAPFNPLHLKTFIQRKFSLLKDEIDPSCVADMLIAEGIISNRDVEMISEERFRIEKCDILLKAIARSLVNTDIHTPRKVMEAFEKEGYGHLFLDLENEKGHAKVTSTEQVEEQLPTKEEIKGRLYVNSRVLEDEIDPIFIIDDLVSEEVLTFDEHQDIKTTDFKPNKVRSLIEYILRKPENVFLAFCNVLDKHYPSLAVLLKNGTSTQIAVDQTHSLKPIIGVKFIQKSTKTSSNKSQDPANSREKTEVKLCFIGDGKEEEQMIVDDLFSEYAFDIQEEAMEIGFEVSDIQFSSIRINLTSMSRQAQIELLKRCKESPHFVKKWIQKLIMEKHVQRLQEKKLETMTFQIKLYLPRLDERKCSCKLTKEIIVRHFSLMEEGMRCVDQMIKTFGDFEGFDDATRSKFKDLLDNTTSGNRTENFLRQLLELSDTRLHLCLLEREMRETNVQLFKKITFATSDNTEIKLSAADIRRNINFLVDELEPRHFRDMLTGLQGSEHIVEKVTSTEPRKDRCRELLNFILQKKPSSVEMFVQELQRLNKDHIVEFLVASKNDEEQTDLKEAVVERYKDIVDEIEPRRFRQMFVDRRIIKAKEIDAICKLSTRRHRAILFMKCVLKEKRSALKCFIDALDVAGYRHLVQVISADLESYKDCPRLYQSLFGGNNIFQIDGEIQLDFKQGDIKESPLQVFLHRMIYNGQEEVERRLVEELEAGNEKSLDLPEETLVKRQRTSEWIQKQRLDRKRERNYYGDERDEPTGCKQFCPEVILAVRELSPLSSRLLSCANRQDELAENCSSARLTRTFSMGSEEKPLYEDISPPTSPGRVVIDKPHVIIKAPCSPLNMVERRRRKSLSDGYSRSSSITTSPSSSIELCENNQQPSLLDILGL